MRRIIGYVSLMSYSRISNAPILSDRWRHSCLRLS